MNKLNPDKIQYFIDLISPQVNNLEKKKIKEPMNSDTF